MMRSDREPFAIAGLWEPWNGNGEGKKTSFTVITTEPNDLVGAIHYRMPAALAPGEEETWLHGEAAELESMLDPVLADEIRTYPVSKTVNSPKNDSHTVVEEVAPESEEQTRLGDFG